MNFPETGVATLSLDDGSVRKTAALGSDLVAVTVSDDGKVAYLADSAPGDVIAVGLPDLKTRWKSHVGGAPFGLLLNQGRLYATLFDLAEIVELDPTDGRVIKTDPTVAHPAAMAVDDRGVVNVGSAGAFGVTYAGGDLWRADYAGSTLRRGDGRTIPLPLAVHPFWLATGTDGKLLIAAEGDNEDGDPGAVLSYDPLKAVFATIARPRDPDQVIEYGSTIFVPAHGDHEVLAIRGHETQHWAPGAAAVALAPDRTLGLLVVAVNAHE